MWFSRGVRLTNSVNTELFSVSARRDDGGTNRSCAFENG